MQRIHWGFFFCGILGQLIFLIVFFQNFNPIFFANWQFLFFNQVNTSSGIVVMIGFLGGFFTAACFLFAVKGGRYDPSPSVHGKDQPDAWERIADQN